MANSKFKCRGCKEYFPTEQAIKVNSGRFHDIGCAVGYGTIKATKAKEKSQNKKHKELKKKVRDNDKSFWTKKAQASFNKYIRLRDDNLPCVSCNRHHPGQYHAGHYRSVGSCPELRFCELQVWKQCAPCNNHLSGNPINYRIELLSRIGEEKVAWVEGHHEINKYTIQDLKDIHKKYSDKTKEQENV